MKPMTLRTKGRLKTSESRFTKTRSVSFSKPYQSGMTLIEVLVAMFVLAIGVLALLAIQLRTVSSVREAEGQTIVSQLTQNLVEGMLINPRLEECTRNNGQRGFCKTYIDYYITAGSSDKPKSEKLETTTDISKKILAKAQIAQFDQALRNALPDSEFYYEICRDGSNKEPTYNGTFHSHCDKKTDADTVIKVLWLKDIEEGKAASDAKTYKDSIIYTYQVRVRER
jgi:type IV pilus modification protein pilV